LWNYRGLLPGNFERFQAQEGERVIKFFEKYKKSVAKFFNAIFP
jgi:hypothetical protein